MAYSLVTIILAFFAATSLAAADDLDAYLIFFKTLDNYKRSRLEEAYTLVNTDYFNSSQPTDLYTFGYNGTVNGTCTKTMLKALWSNSTNLILLDWQKAASAGPIPYILYPGAVENSKQLGIQLGKALVNMTAAGMDLNKLHLLGLSLGAHLCGGAGREVNATLGVKVGRITGLDPAGPGYSGIEIEMPLQCGDAQGVVAIHTDLSGYGSTAAISDVDIYANCQDFADQATRRKRSTYNYTNEQPGCPPRNEYPPMSEQNLCSHSRSCLLYAEALSRPQAEPCGVSTSCSEWIASNGVFSQINYIGPNVDTTIKGMCYLSTNAASLYGKGSAGLKP